MKRVLFVAPNDVPRNDYGFTPDLLIWPARVAPDSSLLPKAGEVVTAASLLGDEKEIQRCSYQMAHNLWQNTGYFRSVSLLKVLEDALAIVCHEAYLQDICAASILERIKAGDSVIIQAPQPLMYKRLIRQVENTVGPIDTITSTAGRDFRKLISRFRMLKGEARQGWRSIAGALLERLDLDRKWLHILGPVTLPTPPASFKRKPVLAYSAAAVFSSTMLVYRDMLGEWSPVVNGAAAARPFQRQGVPFRYIWEYRKGNPFPEEQIHEHITALMEEVGGQPAKQLLAEMGCIDHWRRYALPEVARLVCMFERMVDDLAPEKIVVANQGSSHEAVLLELTRQRNIPSLMLQHGVFGNDFLDYQPLRTDELWVRGQFWYDIMPTETKKHTRVVGNKKNKHTAPRRRDAIIFFSAPVNNSPFMNIDEHRELVQCCQKAACALGRQFVFRVHPRENPSVYSKWLGGMSSPYHRVEQGGPIEALLDQARMVITFSSTLLMDCLHRSIPLISFEWHPFRYKDRFEEQKIFLFARSLAHLEQLMAMVDADPEAFGCQLSTKANLFDIHH